MPDIDEHLGPLADFMERGIPFNRHLGMKVASLSVGACRLELPFDEVLVGDPTRPALHGGVISTLADTAGGLACFSTLESAEDRVSTVDLRVDYLRPAPPQTLWCAAHVVRAGNRVAVTRMEVFAGEGEPNERSEPVATATGVYNVVRR